MEIVSIGPSVGGPEGLRTEIAAVASRLDGKKLGIVYLPFDADHSAYLAAAAEGLGGPVVGATTGGAAFTERGVTRDRPVAAILSGRDFDFSISVAHDVRKNPAAQLGSAARRLVNAAHRAQSRSQVVLALADAFSCDGEVFCSALQSSIPPHWRLLGGTAGDDFRFKRTLVFAGTEVLTDAAVLIGLFSDARASIVAHHGWRPVENGREFDVTDIEGGVLKTLDGRPAAEVYREELARLGLLQRGGDLVAAMAMHELGARTLYGTELKIRSPIRVNDDGSLVLAGSLPAGTIVRVVTAAPDELIGAARTLSARALEPLAESGVRGALVFDCAARLHLLRDRYPEQVAAFLGGRHFPMVGMACYGEIAKFAGSLDGFHNATAVMAAW
jgi:hypothetical protein